MASAALMRPLEHTRSVSNSRIALPCAKGYRKSKMHKVSFMFHDPSCDSMLRNLSQQLLLVVMMPLVLESYSPILALLPNWQLILVHQNISPILLLPKKCVSFLNISVLSHHNAIQLQAMQRNPALAQK